MLKYKGIELREEDINKTGVELLICVKNRSNLSNKTFEKMILEIIPKYYPSYTYVENYDDRLFEVRGGSFTFNKIGVKKLKETYYALKEDLKDAEINIGVYTEDLSFVDGDYSQDEMSLEEFERNIEFID